MILYENEYEQLNKFLKENTGTFSAALIRGHYGKGKSTLINQVLESLSCPKLLVCHYPGMNTPYEALTSALQQQLQNYTYDMPDTNIEISYREYLKQLCIQICKQTFGLVIVFQDMKDYDREITELIREIIIFLDANHIPCFVIMEFSTDNLTFDQQEQLMECTSLCRGNNITLNNEDYKEYIQYFSNLLCGKNNISLPQMKSIIKEAFYNPSLIKKMVYYFVDVGIFYQYDDCWYCDEIDFHLTAKLFEKHISQRYSKLDEVLKMTLNKACITGFEINPRLLYQPLGIIKSEENLRRIERLSRLIIHTENSYEFENNTVYNLINDKMNISEKKALHLLVAEYLYKKIDDYGTTNSVLHLLYIIKMHYLNAEHIDEALHIIGCYIQKAFEQRNYDAALSGIREFRELSNGRFSYAEQQLSIKEAEILRLLGKFSEACQHLNSIKNRYLPTGYEYWIEYWKSYCLFNSGQTNEAQKKADTLIKKLENKQIYDDYLLLKLDILLAGMYHHFGNITYASRRYEQGIAISAKKSAFHKEYNYLLSISNMFLDNELAIKQITKSMKYFKEKHLMVSYAKSANNVAINFIYLGKYENAAEHLKYSVNIFNDICSISYHYPLNNLGTVYAHLGQYDKAMDCFIKARKNPIESFSTLWITMNIANCKRKLGNIEECQKLLEVVNAEISKMNCNTYLLKRNFCISNALLQLEKEDYVQAYKNCRQALEIEINDLNNDTYRIYLSKLLAILAEKSDNPLPQIALAYKDSVENPFCKNLLDFRTHWGNLLFWET